MALRLGRTGPFSNTLATYTLVRLLRRSEFPALCLALTDAGCVSERPLEDHESVVTVHSVWPHMHTNRFVLRDYPHKHALFAAPQKYFPQHLRSLFDASHLDADAAPDRPFKLNMQVEKARIVLQQELFLNSNRTPELKGYMHAKEGKKGWRKRYFMLRTKGLYFSTKGNSEDPRHLSLFVSFRDVSIGLGVEYDTFAKAPFPFCVVFKPNDRKHATSVKVRARREGGVCCGAALTRCGVRPRT